MDGKMTDKLKPCPVESIESLDNSPYEQRISDACEACQNRAPDPLVGELVALVEAAIDSMPEPPDRNCSCHISPPCADCVEWSGLREWHERAKQALAKVVKQ